MNATELGTAAQLRALVDAAAPAVSAPPGLAEQALTGLTVRSARRRSRRRLAAGIGAAVLAGSVAAAGLTGNGDYRAWTQPSEAMMPVVAVGQTVILERDVVPQRGDVVLIAADNASDEFETLIRVIGLPGDTVACPAAPDGTCTAVTVSGRPISEPWLVAETAPFLPVVVGPGEVFLLGDARDRAVDSRMIGPQRLDAVLGIVVARVTEGGQRESLPGSPVRDLPGGDRPVDPPDPVPPAPAR